MQAIIKEAQEKLCDKLVNTGWLTKLRFFVRSADFEDLLLSLSMELEEGRRFTPSLSDVFKCFEATPYEELKVVFVLPEPWTNPLLNDGLALSTKDIKETPSYYTFITEMERDLGHCGVPEGNLYKIATQGVLLLNMSLTTQIQNPGKHNYIWEDFMNYLFDILNKKDNLVWVFFGENKYSDVIKNQSHTKLYVPSLPESKIQVWESNNIFSRLNKVLEDKKLIKIIW